MPGLYTKTTRTTGELINAEKYNADHQNHIDNQTPEMTDDYSATVTQMRSVADPGAVSSESLATSLAGELERIRFMIKLMNGVSGGQWYSSPVVALNNLLIVGDTFNEVTVANTASETGLFNVTLGGNRLGANGVMHGSVVTYVNSILNNATLSLKYYFGGTLVHNPLVWNNSGSTQAGFGIKTDFRIHNRNNAAAQGVSFASMIERRHADMRFATAGPVLAEFTTFAAGGTTINTAVDQAIQLNVQWSGADPGNSCFGLGLDTWRTKI